MHPNLQTTSNLKFSDPVRVWKSSRIRIFNYVFYPKETWQGPLNNSILLIKKLLSNLFPLNQIKKKKGKEEEEMEMDANFSPLAKRQHGISPKPMINSQ